MKAFIPGAILFLLLSTKLQAQVADQLQQKDAALSIITIPVVVHVLYNTDQENISDKRIQEQIEVLNQAFRRKHADTVNTPAAFKSIAADCGIEFKLAISDPQRRATTGIIRKKTNVSTWLADDKMKFAASGGSDAWDATQYLNIWVCNMRKTAGYATFPGGAGNIDGVVLNFSVVGLTGPAGYNLGRTAVHETGHWLGLKHIWGDTFCGDDGVTDTPPQSTYTATAPTSFRQSSCNPNSAGDMWMNFMDLTPDASVNIFTRGQKERIHTFFAAGASRSGLLNSVGLTEPLMAEAPVVNPPAIVTAPPVSVTPTDKVQKIIAVKIYPNPVQTSFTLDLNGDNRWIGQSFTLINAQGVQVKKAVINSATQSVDITSLKPGFYALVAKSNFGETIRLKIIRQ